MRVLKRIVSQLHRYVIWAMALTLLWSFVYTRVGDRPREKKLVLYLGAYAAEDRALSLRLEEAGLPQGIELIQARSASYDLFGSTRDGDLYLIRETDLRTLLSDAPDRLAPLELPEGMEGFVWEGETLGLRVFDPLTQRGPAMSYIQYTPIPDPEPDAYYLCFDRASCHLETNPGAIDNAAWELAMELIQLDK